MSNFKMTVTPTFQKVGRALQDISKGFKLQRELERFSFAIQRESRLLSPKKTGLMRSTIFVDIGNLEARIGPHTFYAVYVHEGTWKMAARPFMKWGVDLAEHNLYGDEAPFVAHVETVIDEGLGGL